MNSIASLLKGISSVALGMGVVSLMLVAKPVSAADLGGECCADLEERIAELEATAARKGNRKVTLTVSGFVNEAVLFWDDGKESNAYVVTTETAQDRFRFVGEAEIARGWKAGYLLEIGVRGAREDRVNQFDVDGGASANGVGLRHSAWYLDSASYGKVWVGQTSEAGDGITEINLANTNQFVGTASWSNMFGDQGAGFFIRRRDGVLSNLHWGSFVAQGLAQGIPGEGHRYNVVRYDTPEIGGFMASASWGEDDHWSVALRYSGQISRFKLSTGIAYIASDDLTSSFRRGVGDTEEVGLSGSILDTESGLYATAAWGQLHDDGLDALYGRNVDDDTRFYTVQAGIERKFIPLGKTTIFGEYFQLDRGAGFAVNASNTVSILDVSDFGTGLSQVANSQITGWGVGINQNLSEAVDVYLGYRHIDIDVTTTNTAGTASAKANLDPIQFVTAGAMIKF